MRLCRNGDPISWKAFERAIRRGLVRVGWCKLRLMFGEVLHGIKSE